jgi:hypothetical protein
MSYPNMEEMNDSIYSKSKPLHPINIWNNNKDNEVNDSCLVIPITKTINKWMFHSLKVHTVVYFDIIKLVENYMVVNELKSPYEE